MMFGFVGSARAQFSPAERAKLIEDAKKEGKVVFYTGASANDGNALKAAFEKKYPFLKMEYFRAGKDKLLGKYLTEVRNNTFCRTFTKGASFLWRRCDKRVCWRATALLSGKRSTKICAPTTTIGRR